MKIIEIPFEKLPEEYRQDVLDGYLWGCQCGESYQTQEAAENCRNCRKYLEHTPDTVYFTPKPKGN